MDEKDIEAYYESLEACKAVLEALRQKQDSIGLNKEERMKYEESLKVYRDQLVMMEYERQQGKAEGKAEERFKNARGMKAAGIAPDLIAQITGLPLDTIRGL